MAKAKVNRTKIKAFKVREIDARAEEMKQAIFVTYLAIFVGVIPMTSIALGTLITNYINSRSSYRVIGKSKKGENDTAKAALLEGLLLFANYVDGIAEGNIDILIDSTLPYTGQAIGSGALITNGAKATGVKGKSGNVGQLSTSCNPFVKGVRYHSIIVQGSPLPANVITNLNGQLILLTGVGIPTYVLNLNGKRNKSFTNLIPGAAYYIYYFIEGEGVVSDLSLPVKINAGE